jgi:hypothetical protein
MYGTVLMAVEPSIRAGVANVPGNSIVEVSRFGVFRPTLAARAVAARTPSLSNGSLPSGFNENIPLRNQPVLINTFQVPSLCKSSSIAGNGQRSPVMPWDMHRTSARTRWAAWSPDA